MGFDNELNAAFEHVLNNISILKEQQLRKLEQAISTKRLRDSRKAYEKMREEYFKNRNR